MKAQDTLTSKKNIIVISIVCFLLAILMIVLVNLYKIRFSENVYNHIYLLDYDISNYTPIMIMEYVNLLNQKISDSTIEIF